MVLYSSGDVLLRCPETVRCRLLAPAMSCSAFLRLVAKAVSARLTTSPFERLPQLRGELARPAQARQKEDTRSGRAAHSVRAACVDVWRFRREYATRHRGMEVALDDDRMQKINWSDSADFLRLRAGSSGDVGQTASCA